METPNTKGSTFKPELAPTGANGEDGREDSEPKSGEDSGWVLPVAVTVELTRESVSEMIGT